MVRRYLPEREDGLVSWSVAGKPLRVRTTLVSEDTRSGAHSALTRVAKREPTSGTGAAGTVRRPGRAGERREGTPQAGVDQGAAAEAPPA